MTECEHPQIMESIDKEPPMFSITLQCPDCEGWIGFLGEYERGLIEKWKKSLEKE